MVDAARSAAREHLRHSQPFVWNATNLSRRLRGGLIDLCHAYQARVRIVAAEASATAIHERNRARARPVPDAALNRMLRSWEAPDHTEAHQLTCIDQPAP